MVSTSLPSKSTSPGHRRARRLQPEDGAGQGRLAAARLPRHADDLAALDGQVDAADGGQATLAGRVGDVEVADLEQRRAVLAAGSSLAIAALLGVVFIGAPSVVG